MNVLLTQFSEISVVILWIRQEKEVGGVEEEGGEVEGEVSSSVSNNLLLTSKCHMIS